MENRWGTSTHEKEGTMAVGQAYRCAGGRRLERIELARAWNPDHDEAPRPIRAGYIIDHCEWLVRG